MNNRKRKENHTKGNSGKQKREKEKSKNGELMQQGVSGIYTQLNLTFMRLYA